MYSFSADMEDNIKGTNTYKNEKVELKHHKKKKMRETGPLVTVNYQMEIVWRNVIKLALLHLAGVYGFYLLLLKAKWATLLWGKYLS